MGKLHIHPPRLHESMDFAPWLFILTAFALYINHLSLYFIGLVLVSGLCSADHFSSIAFVQFSHLVFHRFSSWLRTARSVDFAPQICASLFTIIQHLICVSKGRNVA